MTQRLFRTLALLLLLALTALPALACPFCSPVEADLYSEVQEAQAVVVVQKLESQKYKIVEVWKGNAAVGKVVLAGEARGKPSTDSRLVLTTAGPPNLPYWSDSPRHLTPADLAFVKKSLVIAKAGAAERWDFAAASLEQGSDEVATAAYSILASAPLREVQARAAKVGHARLLGWVRQTKIPAERRALYLLMAYPRLQSQDGAWLRAALFSPQLDPLSPLLGPYVVAYLHATGPKGLSEIEARFLGPNAPASRTLVVTRALALVGHHSGSANLKAAITQTFLKELQHPDRGAFAIAPLAVWQVWPAASKVESLAREQAQTTWVKVAVIRYFRSFSSAEAQAALSRLAKSDPQLVQRTRDGYKVRDLGIE